MISDNDFKGRLFALNAILPRFPLSINVSTASCNIRFSFRIINWGASISNKRNNLLFLVMIRLYNSFKSEVAKRPPSS